MIRRQDILRGCALAGVAAALSFAGAPAQDFSRVESTRRVYRWTESLQLQGIQTTDKVRLSKQLAGFGAMAKAAGVSREELAPGIVEAYQALKTWTSDENDAEPLGLFLYSPAHALRTALETWSLLEHGEGTEIDAAAATEIAEALKTGQLTQELGERHFAMAQAAIAKAEKDGTESPVAAWSLDPNTPKGVAGLDRDALDIAWRTPLLDQQRWQNLEKQHRTQPLGDGPGRKGYMTVVTNDLAFKSAKADLRDSLLDAARRLGPPAGGQSGRAGAIVGLVQAELASDAPSTERLIGYLEALRSGDAPPSASAEESEEPVAENAPAAQAMEEKTDAAPAIAEEMAEEAPSEAPMEAAESMESTDPEEEGGPSVDGGTAATEPGEAPEPEA